MRRKLEIEISNIIIHQIARNVKSLREQPTCLGGLFFYAILIDAWKPHALVNA